MLVIIRGAGDLASGIALRLHRSGIKVVMTDIEKPTSIRRTVCFSEAIVNGKAKVEDAEAEAVVLDSVTPEEIRSRIERILSEGKLVVAADPECSLKNVLKPDALVDAILAKRNLGTKITDAPVVIGVGPGFTTGIDCHAAVETMRGHMLGRAIYNGSPIPNTNIPGFIGGFSGERVLRAPANGPFESVHRIGDIVTEGETMGYVNGQPMKCTISGVLRGLIADGTVVTEGLKCGDVDPRAEVSYCYSVSDKASAVGGGVLEAILRLSGVLSQAYAKTEK